MSAARWIAVAAVADVPPGQVKAVTAEGKRLALCHLPATPQGAAQAGAADAWYAVDDLCTHDDGPLAEGTLDGLHLECPRHGARFDVQTGQVKCLPAVIPITSYPVKVEGGHVLVNIG